MHQRVNKATQGAINTINVSDSHEFEAICYAVLWCFVCLLVSNILNENR